MIYLSLGHRDWKLCMQYFSTESFSRNATAKLHYSLNINRQAWVVCENPTCLTCAHRRKPERNNYRILRFRMDAYHEAYMQNQSNHRIRCNMHGTEAYCTKQQQHTPPSDPNHPTHLSDCRTSMYNGILELHHAILNLGMGTLNAKL